MGRFYGLPASVVPGEIAVSAGNAGWASVANRALYYNGYVYVGTIDGSGNVKIVTYRESTEVTTTSTLHATLEVDWHDNPSLVVAASGKLVTAYCKHASGTDALYIRISTNTLAADPTISGGWGSETNIDSSLGGTQYTYPTLFRLTADSDKLYLVYRNYGSSTVDVKWAYSTSANDGATWAAQTTLFQSQAIDYLHVDSDGVSRIDFVTDGGPNNTGKLYHFYLTPSGRFTTAGATISTSPMTEADLTPVATITGAAALGILTNSGNPQILVPAYSAPTSTIYRAAWNGATWALDASPIVSFTYASEAWGQYGGIAFDGPSVFYTAHPVSGTWEIVRYRTVDGGTTWTDDTVSASADDSFYPVAVRDGAKTRVVWMDGTASSYTSWSAAIMGARLA